ncbi:MAG: cytochrome c oxidase subunit II [Flavobacteriales bacterium]|nr:cytochrome c oxidase subunit II [Flavobacteriales bacterium]
MVTFLIIVAIALASLAVWQLLRVFEGTAKLKGGDSFVPTDAENKYQGRMMLLFMFGYFAFFAWLYVRYAPHFLPESASEHGLVLDQLLDFNFLIITVVFVITHVFLFYFAFKYTYSSDRKATFFTHSNKLELLWTTVPAVFLAVIIVYGLSAWMDITDEAPEGSLTIELYPKQFDWTARYSGSDSLLGASNYNMISGVNPLGVITNGSLTSKQQELTEEIAGLKEELETVPKGGLKEEEIIETIGKRERQLARVSSFEGLEAASLVAGDDDILVKTEFYLPVGESVEFIFRSRDVIHSAYMPHFRAQMNCVPGMTTSLNFISRKTTEEMREITDNPDFDYLLLCNKICGAAHYNMQMVIKVVEPEVYSKWITEQETFAESIQPADEEGMAEATNVTRNEISMIEQ